MRLRRRWATRPTGALAVGGCLVVAACGSAPAPAPRTSPTPSAALTGSPSPSPSSLSGPARSAWLAGELRQAVADQRFGDLVDFATGARVATTPNLDVAVIELDTQGRPAAVADTLLSADHPQGVSVAVDPGTLAATSVRWRVWDGDRWSRGRSGTTDVVAGRTAATTDFIAPYPASVFKLMVAFGVFRLADKGVLSLDAPYAYRPRASGCAGGTRSGTRTVRAWLDAMLTYSDNWSTCALVKRLHDAGSVDALNATLADLGLTTLKLGGTSAANGGGWSRRSITMTSLDTARLLLLVSGAPGVLWRTSGGREVRADVLSPASRAAFLRLLGDQGLNHALSTANWCGQTYPAAGIPQRVPTRWIDPADGTVSVEGRNYRGDVRGCNARAEVTFAHKTGLVDLAGADAGIVTSLPGARPRRYVVVVFSTLGCRFGDAALKASGRSPCSGSGIYYSEKLARLGQRIDRLLTTGPPA